MSNPVFVGWDIGGAHLKVASLNHAGQIEFIEHYSTPLWLGIEYLEKALARSLSHLPGNSPDHLITMTAELVDIFSNRQQGLNSLITICQKILGTKISFYASGKGFLNSKDAQKNLNHIASANWHVSASYAASRIEQGIFIDVGSTTSDIIPFSNGSLNNKASDDQGRLRSDELLYSGVIRTPLMSLANKIPFNGDWQLLAAENFATTADIYRISGDLKDGDDLTDAADSGTKDIDGSMRRLARMLGTDANNVSQQHYFYQLANYFAERQLQLLYQSLARIISGIEHKKPGLVGAGVGRFLIKRLANRMNLPYREFSDLFELEQGLKHKCNICAPAVALAQIKRCQTTA